VKEKVRVQHQQIALLEKQLRTAKADLQTQLELSVSQDQKLAELRAEIKEMSAELQRTEEKLARIREAAGPTPSGLKRARIREERNDTRSSARASKRHKVRFEKSVETESAAEEIFGDEVMSEDDD
jgi:hypothetical protein